MNGNGGMVQQCGHDERFVVVGALNGCVACELEKTARELREERAANERALDQRSQAMLWLLRETNVGAIYPRVPSKTSDWCEVLATRAGGIVGQQLALFADALRRQGE